MPTLSIRWIVMSPSLAVDDGGTDARTSAWMASYLLVPRRRAGTSGIGTASCRRSANEATTPFPSRSRRQMKRPAGPSTPT
jgi:hypothetical protein